MTTTLTLDLVGWRDTRGRFAQASADARRVMAAAVQEQGDVLVKAAQDASPEGQHPFGTPTGYVHFKDAWRATYVETDTGAEATLENVAPHADYVLYPTRPHDIHAVERKSATNESRMHTLRFAGPGGVSEGDGDVVFRRSVHHPGTKGNPVGEKAWAAVEAGVTQALGRVAATVSSEIAEAWGRTPQGG